MKNRWRTLREYADLSQFALARRAGVSRVRISLWELGELPLTKREEQRIRTALLHAIEGRAERLRKVLAIERGIEQGADTTLAAEAEL